MDCIENLAAERGRNAKAKKTFDGFSYSNRREYVDWITEAKREETRKKRLATAIQWLAEGKQRHWKYQNGRSQKACNRWYRDEDRDPKLERDSANKELPPTQAEQLTNMCSAIDSPPRKLQAGDRIGEILKD